MGKSTIHDIDIRPINMQRAGQAVVLSESVTPISSLALTHFKLASYMQSKDTHCRIAYVNRHCPAGVLIYSGTNTYRRRAIVIHVAVARAFQRCGVGASMIEEMVDILGDDRVFATLVPEGLLAAQCFFRSQGFRAEAIERDVFSGEWPDGYYLVRRGSDGID